MGCLRFICRRHGTFVDEALQLPQPDQFLRQRVDLRKESGSLFVSTLRFPDARHLLRRVLSDKKRVSFAVAPHPERVTQEVECRLHVPEQELLDLAKHLTRRQNDPNL